MTATKGLLPPVCHTRARANRSVHQHRIEVEVEVEVEVEAAVEVGDGKPNLRLWAVCRRTGQAPSRRRWRRKGWSVLPPSATSHKASGVFDLDCVCAPGVDQILIGEREAPPPAEKKGGNQNNRPQQEAPHLPTHAVRLFSVIMMEFKNSSHAPFPLLKPLPAYSLYCCCCC